MRVTKEARQIAEVTTDAYSYSNYRDWAHVVQMLLDRGYIAEEVKSILRSLPSTEELALAAQYPKECKACGWTNRQPNITKDRHEVCGDCGETFSVLPTFS